MNRQYIKHRYLDSISDKALMMKVKDGDLDKLGLLFERYNYRLFGFFYRLTLRRDISEDLVQGVFERVLRYRKSYSSNGDFSTWIFRIARNHHADYYRKSEKMVEEEHAADVNLIPDSDTGPEINPGEDFHQELLRLALKKLDPEKKQALILSRFHGFKYREIAEIMECTESAVKVRIFRAIQELKEIITKLRKQEKL